MRRQGSEKYQFETLKEDSDRSVTDIQNKRKKPKKCATQVPKQGRKEGERTGTHILFLKPTSDTKTLVSELSGANRINTKRCEQPYQKHWKTNTNRLEIQPGDGVLT